MNGLAIEFHGAFDYSSFDEDAVTQLDYCTSTSDAPTKYNSTTAATDATTTRAQWTQQAHTARNRCQCDARRLGGRLAASCGSGGSAAATAHGRRLRA